MELSSNYNEFLEILREKCKTQRKLMNYSQEKVCQILEERYGLVKDVSKISLYESGKTRNPDFLPEYCELLNIQFPDMLCKNMEGYSMIEKNTTYEVVEAAEVGTEEKNTIPYSNTIWNTNKSEHGLWSHPNEIKCFGETIIKDIQDLTNSDKFPNYNTTVINGLIQLPHLYDLKDIDIKMKYGFMNKLGEIEKTYDVEDFILVKSPYPWFPRTYYIRQKHNEKLSKYGYYMKDLFKQSSGIKDFIKLYTPVICIDYCFKKANLVHSIRIPLTGSDRDDAYASLHITLKLFSPKDYKMTLATCASLKNEYGWKVDEYMSNGGDFYKRSCNLSEDNKPIIDYKQVDVIPLHRFKYWNLIVL